MTNAIAEPKPLVQENIKLVGGTNLNGIKIKTINARQPFLYFLPPIIGIKGDALQNALNEYEDFSYQDEDEEITRVKRREKEKQQQELCAKVLIESLKQQYKIDPIAANDFDGWFSALGNYFITQDLLRITLSIQAGYEWTQKELIDMAKNEQLPKKKLN